MLAALFCSCRWDVSLESKNNIFIQLSVIMADGGDNVFVYLGGEQEVPRNVTHVIIDRSVKIFQRGHSINVF